MNEIIEKIKLRINKFLRIKLSERRKKQLLNEEFTIISNNCWAGMIYESYNIEKKTPTVGLFFMAKDYIKFISNIRYYLRKKIHFIEPTESKYYEFLKKEKITCPIGILDDEIEIFFLHYNSKEEILEKWERRKKRINWNRIIYKFNDQNECSDDDLVKFVNLPLPNKILFTCRDIDFPKNNCHIFHIKQILNKKSVNTSNELFGKKITNFINMIK